MASNAVVQQNTGKNLTTVTAGKVKDLLEKNRGALMKSLPQGFNYERMCRVVINAISTTPAIAECRPDTIFLSTVRAFSCGLEPNGALNEGYLVPFFNGKSGQKECQFMPSYRGLINLARRSGEISKIYAKTVHENDEFEVEEGTEQRIRHTPDYFGNRGKAVGYYAVFTLKDGSVDFEIMGAQEIEAVRSRSKAKSSGPWQTDYDEMAKKTVLKRLLKRAPARIELGSAMEYDHRAAMGDDQSDIIDVDMSEIEIDIETPAEIQAEINRERLQDVKAKISEKMSQGEPEATSPVMDGVELVSDGDVKELSTLLNSAKKSSDDLIAYYHMELGREDINGLHDFTKADLVEIKKMLNKKTKAA